MIVLVRKPGCSTFTRVSRTIKTSVRHQFSFTARRFISTSTSSTVFTFTSAATLACNTSRIKSGPAAVKRLLAEWTDADFFEPHYVIRTMILQADIANLRSLVLTLRFPVLFPFWKIRGLGIKRANAFAIDIDVDEISLQGYDHCSPAISGERRQRVRFSERIDGTRAMLFVTDFTDLHFKTAMDWIPGAEFLFRFDFVVFLVLLFSHLLVFGDFQDAVLNANKDARIGPGLLATKDNSNLAVAKRFLRIQQHPHTSFVRFTAQRTVIYNKPPPANLLPCGINFPARS